MCKMFPFLTSLFVLQTLLIPNRSFDVKIGLMIPHEEVGFIKYMYGFSTTAGAATMALDRIKDEQLLPEANFR